MNIKLLKVSWYFMVGHFKFYLFFLRFCDRTSNIIANLVRTARTNEFDMHDAIATVTGYGMDDRGIMIRFPGGVTDFSLPQIVLYKSLWGPPKLLADAYRGVISVGKLAGLEAERAVAPV
jgi:hypothetical protein